MADGKFDRRSFLQLATSGLAGTAIGPTASAAEAMPKPAAGDPRPAAVFAYGYHQDPYKLEPGPQLFIDWRYVEPGRVKWRTPEGKDAKLFAYKKVEGVTGTPLRTPYGLKLVPQVAQKTGPVLPNDREWEFMIFGYCTLLDLGGKFGLWYEVVPPQGSGARNLLCYAESVDGVSWTKPDLGLVEFKGSKKNNIVIDGAKCPYGSFHGNSVFIDPNAPAAERFKVAYWAADLPPEVIAQLKREWPESFDPSGESHKCGVMLGTSPDGLRWKFTGQLLFSHTCDTQTIMGWDALLHRYVCFTRTHQLGRRSIGRTETADIMRWPVPEMILWTPADSDPADDLYCNSKSLYPGTKTMHLVFPTMYKRRVDGCALRMASSLDTVAWQWLPGEVMQCGAEGSWDGGCFLGGCGLTEIPGDRVVLPYGGYVFPHKYPRFDRVGQIGFASWQKERLVALQADEDAEFWTPELSLPADTLHLNYEVKRAGYIKVEVEGVKGRGLEDCDALLGSSLKKQVTWKGNGSLGPKNGKPVVLRFRMRTAKLFSFEVR